MKKLLAATALSLMSFGALAADLPRRGAPVAPAPVVAAPVFTWTGFYLGGHAGYMWGDVDVNYGETPGGGDIKGFIGGALVGYNWQRGSLVYGVEAEAGFGSVDGKGQVSPPAPIDYSYDLKWNAHLRGRIGVAVDRTFFFAAAGLAVARHKLGESGSYIYPVYVPLIPNEAHAHSGTHYGWTIGAGVEHAWTKNLVTRLEYLYDDYGRKTYDAEDGLKVRLSGHTVRAALIWKF